MVRIAPLQSSLKKDVFIFIVTIICLLVAKLIN